MSEDKLDKAMRLAEEAMTLIAEIKGEKSSKKDPRIGKLCVVWDKVNPDESGRYFFDIIIDIDYTSNYPFHGMGTSNWLYARLLTEEEIERWVRG